MAGPENNPRYGFTYEGGVTTEAAILQSLVHAGPLILDTAHMVVVMLPGALPDNAAGGKKFTQCMMHASSIGGMLFSPAMKKAGLHFAVTKVRYAKLFRDLDNGGLDMTPITGEYSEVMNKFTKRITAAIKALPDAERTLEVADVIFDGDDIDNPETDTLFDYMTVGMLLNRDDAHVVAQAMNIIPCVF